MDQSKLCCHPDVSMQTATLVPKATRELRRAVSNSDHLFMTMMVALNLLRSLAKRLYLVCAAMELLTIGIATKANCSTV